MFLKIEKIVEIITSTVSYIRLIVRQQVWLIILVLFVGSKEKENLNRPRVKNNSTRITVQNYSKDT